MKQPEITIVTVVFNGIKTIEKTILSVINQDYEKLEYIIIDGGSTDGTIDIIKKYADKIDYWISEPDKGLYFAMNKGLNLAEGKWINFMNSGDSFYTTTIVSEVFSTNYRSGVIYGDVMFSFDGRNSVYVKAQPLENFWKGMQFVHQAAFVSTILMKEFPFDTKYKFIADYNSLYKIFLKGENFQYIELPICNFLAGGLSDNNPRSILECQKLIFGVHKGINVRLFYYYRYTDICES